MKLCLCFEKFYDIFLSLITVFKNLPTVGDFPYPASIVPYEKNTPSRRKVSIFRLSDAKNKIKSTRCRCDVVTKTAMYFAIHEVPFTWRNAIRPRNIKECAFIEGTNPSLSVTFIDNIIWEINWRRDHFLYNNQSGIFENQLLIFQSTRNRPIFRRCDAR